MDGFFKKLQEVTELTTTSGASDNKAATSSAVQDLTMEDLRETVHTLEGELHVLTSKYGALKSEAQSTQDDFAAYKAKVNSWRDQMKAARAQDRKTIEMLRGTSSAPFDATHHGASSPKVEMSTDAAYVVSLEEQVQVLKETIRGQAAERDKLQLDLGKLRELVLQKGSNSTPGIVGEAEVAVGASLREELAQLRNQAEELEGHNAQLQREAVENHATLLNALERLKDANKDDGASQYVKDLERELYLYRKGGQKDSTPQVSGNKSQDEAQGTNVAQQHECELRRVAEERVAQLDEEVREMQCQRQALMAEASLREDCIDQSYDELRMLKGEMDTLDSFAKECRAAHHADMERNKETQEALIHANNEVEILRCDYSTLSLKMIKIQKELANRSELVCHLKKEVFVLTAAQQEHHVSVGTAEHGGPAAGSSVSMDETMTQYYMISSMRWKKAWEMLKSRNIEMWSTTRIRVYGFTVVVCLVFVLLFSFYQSLPLLEHAEDMAVSLALKECERKLTALLKRE